MCGGEELFVLGAISCELVEVGMHLVLCFTGK